jgi:hypothetical protein
MMNSTKLVCVALMSALSTASFAQDAPGQAAPPDLQGSSIGFAPGQMATGADTGGAPGGAPGSVLQTTLTYRSYPIAAGASAGNLEGAACPTPYKMISGACHPFYNDHVTIINQFPNIGGNTWRCGFKNNTTASATVWIYTLCAQ